MKKTNKSRVLITLGMLFCLSAGGRLIPSSMAALKENSVAERTHLDETTLHEATSTTASSQETDNTFLEQTCLTSEAFELFQKDRALVHEKQQSLTIKEVELLTFEKHLSEQSNELSQMQTVLENRWQQMQETANQDLTHLAAMYEVMKPTQAAAIFDQMDPSFAAGFLNLISSEQAGLILAGMDTQTAYIVSLKLAERNQDLRAASLN